MSFPMSTAASVVPMVTLGFALGAVYFAAMRRTALLIATRSGALQAIALTVGRGAVAIAVLGYSAWFGAVPILSAFVGFLLARSTAMRGARRF